MPIIEPSTVNKYTFKNSYEFVQEIKKVDVSNLLMASFDIQSLFTNIPLDKTMEIIINRLFADSPKYMDFSRDQFKELLEL